MAVAVGTSFSLTDAALGHAMSFIVVDPDGVQHEVKTAGKAARYLADAWSRTLETIGERELVPYIPEVVIRADEQRALVITDDLREENEVVEELLADTDRPQVKPSEVSGALYLYAVTSDTKVGRIAMIRKKNPTKRARAGKALFAAGDELRELDEDPWELDPLFDLVVGTGGGYALNTAFLRAALRRRRPTPREDRTLGRRYRQAASHEQCLAGPARDLVRRQPSFAPPPACHHTAAT